VLRGLLPALFAIMAGNGGSRGSVLERQSFCALAMEAGRKRHGTGAKTWRSFPQFMEAWSPGFNQSKRFEPPEGGTPNQLKRKAIFRFFERIGTMNRLVLVLVLVLEDQPLNRGRVG